MQKTAYSCVVFCFFILVLTVVVGNAATFTVDTLSDNQTNGCSLGQCTLREAITDANNSPGSDTINFQSGLTGTINLTRGHLLITSNITINGPGARVLSVSGNTSSRVFVVFGSNAVANINRISIINGEADLILLGASLIGDGGGVLNTAGGTLNLTEVHVNGNHATSLGGGVATRAILPLTVTTTTNIIRSAIYDNVAVGAGGGVSNVGIDLGITGLVSSADTTIINSTITQNDTLAAAGGLNNDGGRMNLTNNTISHNHSTLVGGGVVNVAGLVTGFVYMRNNILAQNSSLLGTNLITSNGLGIFNSLGHNLIGDNLNLEASFQASTFIDVIPLPNANADLVGSVSVNTQRIDPQLNSLANNGGMTNTRALALGSPAIDQADNCVELNNCSVNPNSSNPPSPMPTDQRGTGFLRRINNVVDIGAYEAQVTPTANTYVVNKTTDTLPNGCTISDCTLREAIIDANNNPGNDIIDLTNVSGTIILTRGHLPITSNITINGPGARVLSVSGNHVTRVFVIYGSSAVANINRISIINGDSDLILLGGLLIGDGGGVLNTAGGTLNLTEVHVNGNHATSLGGGVATRAILPLTVTTTTNIIRSAIYDNVAVGAGGGVSNVGVDLGISGLVTSSDTTIINSTITQNDTLAAAGAINNDGGRMNLTSNTISHNHSTLVGGGVVNVAGLVTGFVYMRNNILAQNSSLLGTNLITSNGLGIFNSLGHNLIGDNLNLEASFQASVFVGTTCQPNVNADLVGSISINTQRVDPLLGPLGNNGGTTDTRALMPGSPAIDQADNCVELNNCPVNPGMNNPPSPMPTDQRGTGFLRRINNVVDIGAYEVQLAPTAANVSVSGRVLDENGKPISRVSVSIMNNIGETRTTVTNQFGYYRFEELEAGQIYILSAQHKIYSFTSRILRTIDGDLLDFDITVNGQNRKF